MSGESAKPFGSIERSTDVAEHLDAGRVTIVYTMFHHLGDFVVMSGLLRKFDQLGVGFESLVAHRGSTYVPLLDGKTQTRFFDVATVDGLLDLRAKLLRRKQEGRLLLGIPMAPGSVQAFLFFWALKKLGWLTHIVDFNLVNADIVTPPRRRYIFDRHLAQAAEIFKRPEWLADLAMPLALEETGSCIRRVRGRIGFFPWSGRRHLPEFRWPDTRWLELARLILENSTREIVLLGKNDDFNRFADKLRAGLPENLRGRLHERPAATVPHLIDDLHGVDGLVTLNTSALHLAHALQMPAVALCGSSLESWLPEAAHVRLVRDERGVFPPSDQGRSDPLQPSLQNIEVAQAFQAVREHLLA